MNDEKEIIASLDNCERLKKLILDNPTLPLVIFCGENSYSGTHPYEQALVDSAYLDELIEYNEKIMDRDDYENALYDDLCDEDEYQALSDEEYDKMIREKVASAKFTKAIVIFVGG